MMQRRVGALLAATLLTGAFFVATPALGSGDPVDKNYYVYVAAESEDTVPTAEKF